MSESPLVSICIPTFNRAGMVGKAIESALSQTYQNIEVIVVDNASTDNIEEFVASFDDSRLKFVKNEENLGLFGNFNRCIDLYNGSFLHILHSDDYIDKDFTEKCVCFFKEHPDVWLTSTSSCIIGDDNIKENQYSDKDIVFKSPEGFRRLLSERCFISCPSVMVRRGLYEEIGKFSLEYPYSSDYYQWLRVSRVFDIGYISDAWVNYRIGKHSESYRLLFSTPLGYMDTLEIYTRLVGELGSEVVDYSSELNLSLRRFIGDCIFAGFIRSDNMDNYQSGIFVGIAQTAWSLIVAYSLKSWVIKIYYLLFIFLIFLGIHFSTIRHIAIKIMGKKADLY
ncbi:glycosyltransferase family 2 protein [Methanoplanus endosymbiosus]|uniref:Glycosyltransferase n=1 Tax=Methanoplanus endosymbiosus TaxID=33865 RepID=A0A9E7PKF5_9EURY|nr:glycosyltransferase [Methanoplanus endosymbiosus]UUX91668.1 glycosyltransferase [Methanoplanus endosymbiosus]